MFVKSRMMFGCLIFIFHLPMSLCFKFLNDQDFALRLAALDLLSVPQ